MQKREGARSSVWFSNWNLLPFPKGRNDFRSKWLLLEALHILLFAEFRYVSWFMSQDFVVYNFNLIQLYLNMIAAFFKNLLQRFITLLNNKISALVEICVCYSFIVIYFQRNSILQVISTFLFFPLCCRKLSFHVVYCDDFLLLHQRRLPSPMSCYYHDQIKLKTGILKLAVEFAVSVPNMKKILCPKSVAVTLRGLIKDYFTGPRQNSSFLQVITWESSFAQSIIFCLLMLRSYCTL